jgi:hypothetical protein
VRVDQWQVAFRYISTAIDAPRPALSVMDPLYKYLPRVHAESLVTTGGIRLGTFADYADEELHGEARGDAKEGKIDVFDNPAPFSSGDLRHVSPVVRHVVNSMVGHGGVSFSHCLFSMEQQIPDRWMYCTSDTLSITIRDSFQSADTAVQITDPPKFFYAIVQELERQGLAREHFTVRCVYGNRSFHVNDTRLHRPEALKDAKYENQREVRKVFVPVTLPIAPLILTVSDLPRYCELVQEPYPCPPQHSKKRNTRG